MYKGNRKPATGKVSGLLGKSKALSYSSHNCSTTDATLQSEKCLSKVPPPDLNDSKIKAGFSLFFSDYLAIPDTLICTVPDGFAVYPGKFATGQECAE